MPYTGGTYPISWVESTPIFNINWGAYNPSSPSYIDLQSAWQIWYWDGATSQWTFGVQLQHNVNLTEENFNSLKSNFSTFHNPALGTLASAYPNGCSDIAPPDPCEGEEPDVDNDHDGICNRCDLFPEDPSSGTNVYWYGSYRNSSGNIVAYQASMASPSTIATLSTDVAVSSMVTYSGSGSLLDGSEPGMDPDTYIGANGGSWANQPGEFGSIIGTMAPCECNQDCKLNTTENSPAAGDPLSIPGTAPPDTGQSGTGVGDIIGTPGSSSAPSSVDPGSLVPGSVAAGAGQTDTAYLQNIDNNMAALAANLASIGTNISQAGEYIGNKIGEQTDLMKEQYKSDVLSSSDSSAILGELSSTIDSHATDIQTEIETEIAGIEEREDLPSESWTTGIFDKLQNALNYGSCEDYVYPIPFLNRDFVISCDIAAKVKTIFGFLISIWTIMELTTILFTGITPKGTAQLDLWGK